MDAVTLEQNIRDSINHFPAKTRRVAEYILTNPSQVAFNSISQTAEALSVSRAQLVRVSRMLGFDGYAGLKNALKQKLMDIVDAPSPESGDMLEALCSTEKSNIDKTCRELAMNRGAIAKFCEGAANSRTIYCMGWGISAIPAEWLYTRFSELGLKSVIMRRGSLSLLEQSRSIGRGDMLIVCELPSYVIEVTETAERVSQSGASIITITDGPAAPVCSYSDIQFFAGDNSPLFGSSLVGSMFLVHVLTSYLALNLGVEGERALSEQRESLKDTRIYYPLSNLHY